VIRDIAGLVALALSAVGCALWVIALAFIAAKLLP
jgi:hypothetical protein